MTEIPLLFLNFCHTAGEDATDHVLHSEIAGFEPCNQAKRRPHPSRKPLLMSTAVRHWATGSPVHVPVSEIE